MGEEVSQAAAPEGAGSEWTADPTETESAALADAREQRALRLIGERTDKYWWTRPKIPLPDIAAELDCDEAEAERTVQRLAARGDIRRRGDTYQWIAW
jgi:hypothetical protein